MSTVENALLAKFGDQLKVEEQRLDAEIAAAEEGLSRLRAERRTIKKLEVALSGEQPSSNGKPQGEPNRRLSLEKQAECLEAIRKAVKDGSIPHPFAHPDLRGKTLPVADSSIDKILFGLREDGQIRLTGVREGGNGTPPKLYALVEA